MRDANIIYRDSSDNIVNKAMVIKMNMSEASRSGQQALYIEAPIEFLDGVDVEVLEVVQFNPYYFPVPEAQNRSFGEMKKVGGRWVVDETKRYVSARVNPAKWAFEDSSSSTSADNESVVSEESDSKSSRSSTSKSSASVSISKSSSSDSSSTKNLSSDNSQEIAAWTRRKYSINFRANATYLIVITPMNVSKRIMHANFTVAVRNASTPDNQIDLVSSSSHHDSYAYPTGKTYFWSNRRLGYPGEGYPTYSSLNIPAHLSNLFRQAPTGYDEFGIPYVNMAFNAEVSALYTVEVEKFGPTSTNTVTTIGRGLKAIFYGEDGTFTNPKNWFGYYYPQIGIGGSGNGAIPGQIEAVAGKTYFFRVYNCSVDDVKHIIDPFIRMVPRITASGVWAGAMEFSSSTYRENTTSSSKSSNSSSSYLLKQSLQSRSTLSSVTQSTQSSRTSNSISSYDSRTDLSEGHGSVSGEFVGFNAMSDKSWGGAWPYESNSVYENGTYIQFVETVASTGNFGGSSSQIDWNSEMNYTFNWDYSSSFNGWGPFDWGKYVDFNFMPSGDNINYLKFSYQENNGCYIGVELFVDGNLVDYAFFGNYASVVDQYITLNAYSYNNCTVRIWNFGDQYGNSGTGNYYDGDEFALDLMKDSPTFAEMSSRSSHSSASMNMLSDPIPDGTASQEFLGYTMDPYLNIYASPSYFSGSGDDLWWASQWNSPNTTFNTAYEQGPFGGADCTYVEFPFNTAEDVFGGVTFDMVSNTGDYMGIAVCDEYGTIISNGGSIYHLGTYVSTYGDQLAVELSPYTNYMVRVYNFTDTGDGYGSYNDYTAVNLIAYRNIEQWQELESASSHSSRSNPVVYHEYSSYSSRSSKSSLTSHEQNSTSSATTVTQSSVSPSSKSINSDHSTDSSSSYVEGYISIPESYPFDIVYADMNQGFDGLGRAIVRLKWTCPRTGTYTVDPRYNIFGGGVGSSYGFAAVYTNIAMSGSPVNSSTSTFNWSATQGVTYYILVRPQLAAYNNQSMRLGITHISYGYAYASSSKSSSSSTYHNFNSSRTSKSFLSESSSSSTEFNRTSDNSSSSYLNKESVSTSSSSNDRIYIFEGEEWRSRYGTYTGPSKNLNFYTNRYAADAQGRNIIFCGFRVPEGGTGTYYLRAQDVSGQTPVLQGIITNYGTDSSFQAVASSVSFTTTGSLSVNMTEGFTYWFTIRTDGDNALGNNGRDVTISVYQGSWQALVSNSSSTFRENTSSRTSESSTIAEKTTSSTIQQNSTSSDESESSEIENSTSSQSISSAKGAARNLFKVTTKRAVNKFKFQFPNTHVARVNGTGVDYEMTNFGAWSDVYNPPANYRASVSAKQPIDVNALVDKRNTNYGNATYNLDIVIKANISESMSRFMTYGEDIPIVIRLLNQDVLDTPVYGQAAAAMESSDSATQISHAYFTIPASTAANNLVIRKTIAFPAYPWNYIQSLLKAPISMQVLMSSPFTPGYKFVEDVGLNIDIDVNLWRVSYTGSASEGIFDNTSESSSVNYLDDSWQSYSSISSSTTSITGDTPSYLSDDSWSSTSSSKSDVSTEIFDAFAYLAAVTDANSGIWEDTDLFELANGTVNSDPVVNVDVVADLCFIVSKSGDFWNNDEYNPQSCVTFIVNQYQQNIDWSYIAPFIRSTPRVGKYYQDSDYWDPANIPVDYYFKLKDVIDSMYGAGYYESNWQGQTNWSFALHKQEYCWWGETPRLHRLMAATITNVVNDNSSVSSASYASEPSSASSFTGQFEAEPIRLPTTKTTALAVADPTILYNAYNVTTANYYSYYYWGATDFWAFAQMLTPYTNFDDVYGVSYTQQCASPYNYNMAKIGKFTFGYFPASSYKADTWEVEVEYTTNNNSANAAIVAIPKTNGSTGAGRGVLVAPSTGVNTHRAVFYAENTALASYYVANDGKPVPTELLLGIVKCDADPYGPPYTDFSDIQITKVTVKPFYKGYSPVLDMRSFSSSNSSEYVESTSTAKTSAHSSSSSRSSVSSGSQRGFWGRRTIGWGYGDWGPGWQYNNPSDYSIQSKSSFSSAINLLDTESTNSSSSRSDNDLSSNSSSSDIITTSESLVSNYGIKARTFALVQVKDEARIYFDKLDYISTSPTKTFYKASLRIARGVGDPCGKNQLWAKFDSSVGNSSTEQFGGFDVRVGISERMPTTGAIEPEAGELLLDRCDAPYSESQAWFGDLTKPVGLASNWASFVAARALARTSFKKVTDKKTYATSGTEATLKAEGVNYTSNGWNKFREDQVYSILVVYSSSYANILGDGFYITIKNYE